MNATMLVRIKTVDSVNMAATWRSARRAALGSMSALRCTWGSSGKIGLPLTTSRPFTLPIGSFVDVSRSLIWL
ncbi:unannotated protein [freshwater metagenome]|uniref:Unannotated protein n=1 Tax=freshwater metagenome TaxID=449393 RepID=A0A6J5ZKW8_9ZZZZ